MRFLKIDKFGPIAGHLRLFLVVEPRWSARNVPQDQRARDEPQEGGERVLQYQRQVHGNPQTSGKSLNVERSR